MRRISRVLTTFLLVSTVLATGASTALADTYADAVVAFAPAAGPSAPHLEPTNALGAPNYNNVNSCPSALACTFVSLGSGGSITLEFVDNYLTGSDNTDPDLWIYEVGPDVEDTFVEISPDNVTWFPVGKVFGSTSSVDIDAFGHGSSTSFRFVRLTDDPNEGGTSGATAGADIDAVEALTSVPIPVLPTTWSAVKGSIRLR